MKLPSRNHLLAPLLAFLLAGCGGGGSDPVAVGGAGGGGGDIPGTTPPPPNSQTFVFDYPDFPVGARVTVVSGFQPPGETSPLTAEVVASVQQGPFLGLARMLAQAAPTASALERTPCGTADASLFAQLSGAYGEALHQSAPPVRGRYQELPEGAEENFFLVPVFRSVAARKVLQPNETQHCTIFAEVDAQGQPCVSRDKALFVAQAFDFNNPARPGSGIYQQVRQVFGSEWNQNPPGGNDGDTKVVIFFFRPETLGANLFGYTSPVDQSLSTSEVSNRAEIVYINAGKDNNQTLATIAHEFQHLVNQNEKVARQGTFPEGARDENISVNEGLSGLAEEVCGFDVNSGNSLLATVINDYLGRPEEHEFFNFFKTGAAYGQSYLFFKYVREHFGDQTIRAIVTSTQTGKTNLDQRLPQGFSETFRRWTIANYATNLGGSVPSIYRYPSGFRTNGSYPAGQLQGPRSFPLSVNRENELGGLNAWSASYLFYSGGNGADLRLTVEGAPGSPVGAILESQQGAFTNLRP